MIIDPCYLFIINTMRCEKKFVLSCIQADRPKAILNISLNSDYTLMACLTCSIHLCSRVMMGYLMGRCVGMRRRWEVEG